MSIGALNDKSYHNRDKRAHTICRSISTPFENAFITPCVVCLSYCVITAVFSLGSVVYQVIAKTAFVLLCPCVYFISDPQQNIRQEKKDQTTTEISIRQPAAGFILGVGQLFFF